VGSGRRRRLTPVGARPVTPRQPVGAAVLRFLPLPGWREREALTLRWDEIDLARGLAMLADTKTGRSVRELGPPGLAVVGAVRAASGG
jgi:integrase